MEESQESKVIVTEKDIVKTYPKNTQELVKQYYKVLELRKSGKRIGSLSISRCLKIPESRIKNWIYENKKPAPLHTLEFLKMNDLVPLISNENDEKFLFLVRLLAFCFGDGHIELDSTRFLLYGEKEGRVKISRFLNESPNTVGNWLYHNKQPKYFNNQNEIRELIK